MKKSEKEFLSYISENISASPSFQAIENHLPLSKVKIKKSSRRPFFNKIILFRFSYFVLLAACVVGIASSFNSPNGKDGMKFLSSFSNKKELVNYLRSYGISNSSTDYIKENLSSQIDSGTATAPSNDYSKTNTQDADVDEGDIIKTDGQYIYYLSYDGFKIIETDEGTLSLTFEEQYTNYYPLEMYLNQNKAIIIGNVYDTSPVYYNQISPGNLDVVSCWGWGYHSKTSIRIYDLENVQSPTLTQEITIDGQYHSSRITKNTLYYFVSMSMNYDYETSKLTMPTISDSLTKGGVPIDVDAKKIYYLPDTYLCYYSQLLILGKMNLAIPDSNDYNAYLGSANDAYVSKNYIYQYFYYYDEKAKSSGNAIIKISLDTLENIALCYVDGTILNRYCLDEYNGFLRVATTSSVGWSSTSSNLFIFDETLTQISQITNIAPGERIYSVRFNGDTASIVTFATVDPLFTVDLSDPYNPKIDDGLKKDGVSYYIHYIKNTPYSIAVGRDTEENNGNVTWKGIEVTMYDHSNPTATIVNTIKIGNSTSYCELFDNPRALLYHQERNVFAFAAEEWQYSNYTSTPKKQGLYVFGFENGRLEQRAFLTHFDNDYSYENANDYYNNYFNYVKRGLTIGNFIYTISNHFVRSYSLTNFSLIENLIISSISY